MNIRIGPHTYTVKRVKSRKIGGDCAQIDYARLSISVSTDLVSTYAKQSLLHEIIHGVLENAGIRDQHDEQLVDAMATGILGVLRDNPDVVSYLVSDE